MAAKSRQTAWKNRIVSYDVKPASWFTANEHNWRIHPKDQQEGMRGALDSVGWVQDVIVNLRTSEEWGADQNVQTLVDGHLRVTLALRAGEDTPVPVKFVDLSPSEEAQVLATLDPIAAMAATDKAKLDELMRAVQSDDERVQAMLAEMAEREGLEYGEVEPAEDPGPQVDKAEELREKWGVVPGDVWMLGKHKLACGDCTDTVIVDKLLQGERLALVPTDPPYNVGVNYGNEVDDEKGAQVYEDFCRSWFDLWAAYSTRQIVTPGCNNLASWARWFDPYHVAPWTKTNSMTNGKVSRFWCWEPVFFFGDKWPRKRPNDVFDYPIGQQKDVANHPCPKPLKMWIDLIENYSDPGDLIGEPFSGAGTTIIACEQTGRIARATELEPKYVAVALERWATMTGQTPILLEGGA